MLVLRRIALAPIAALSLLATAVVPGPVGAQQTLRAAAVVNDEVVSALDLEMRVRLALLASGLQDDPDQRQRLNSQVLRTLIDETLQRQEAERLGYDVSQEEIDQAVSQVAGNNNMNPDQFVRALRSHDVLPSAFYAQARASIAWQKIVQRRLRPEVEISDDEIDSVVERIRSRQGERQYQVREIFLSTDDSTQSQEVEQTARRLVQELRGGTDFAALARQFSQSATAAVGGEIGWVTPDNLPESVAEAIPGMSPGEVAGPFKSFNGIHIVKLTDTRMQSVGNATVDLKQLFLPVPEDGDPAAARTRLTELAARIQNCDDVETVVEENDPARTSELGQIKVADLPSHIRHALSELEVGQPSDPLEVTGGLAVLTVCDRSGGNIDREQIRENLVNERLNMISQRYMRDLRHQAHIDVRL